MKKRFLSYVILLFLAEVANAGLVTLPLAQTVATNFCSQHFTSGTLQLNLAYTEYAVDGRAVYYIFDVNTDKGFVIIAAEDAAHPILGFSKNGKFEIPARNNNFAWWMNRRKQEIELSRSATALTSTAINAEWEKYSVKNTKLNSAVSVMSDVTPLLKTIWNQSPFFNALCPGGAVTGCTATTMAQIINYWAYPAHGHGSSFYWDMQAYGYQLNNGYLSANYDTSHYNWSAMQDTVNGPNAEVAKLMYDCGVSVNMDYSPPGSGAWVVAGDNPVCAQNSYVKYFGYNAATIQGVYEPNYTQNNWTSLILNELTNNRPVELAGYDSIDNYSGHTWVCDGYDASSTNFHMNWGWGGIDNGYYNLYALDVASYNFNWFDEAVIGIEPPASSPWFYASSTLGCGNLTVQFQDSSVASSAITSYNWLFPGGNPAQSSEKNPTVVYNNSGSFDVTEIVGSLNGQDTLVRKAYISVSAFAALPMTQTFQSAVFPPQGWVINNPGNYSYTSQLNTSTGGYGVSSQCMYFNNAQSSELWKDSVALWNKYNVGKAARDIIGQRHQIYTPEYNFTRVVNPVIYFDVAYAPYNSSFSDTLAVYYSLDCGVTFSPVYLKGGMTLCTTGNTVMTGAPLNSDSVFTPLSNNWRTDTIHIPGIAGASGVLFSFENRSGNGSPIYIDNITFPNVIPCINPTVPTLSASSSTNCGIQNTTLSIVTGVENDATKWQWYSGSCGGVSVDNGATISVSPSSTTTYFARGEGGCVTPDICASITIAVNPLPSPATITPNGPTTFCQGGEVVLTSSSGNTYLWSTGETTASVTVSTSGHDSLIITDANGCTSASSSAAIVTVNALPAAPVITPDGPTTFCQGGAVVLTSSPGNTYLWSTGETAATITVSVSGSDSLIITDINGCTSASSSAVVVAVYICTGIQQATGSDKLNVYPNPSNGVFTIDLTDANHETAVIKLINTLGQLVYQDQTTEALYSLSVSNLPNGIYYLQVQSGSAYFRNMILLEK